MLGQLLRRAEPEGGKSVQIALIFLFFVSSSWCIVTSVVIFFSVDRGNYLLLLAIKVGFEMNRTCQK